VPGKSFESPLSVLVTPCVFGYALLAIRAQKLCVLFLGQTEDSLLVSFQRRYPEQSITWATKNSPALICKVLKVVNGLCQAGDVRLDPQGTAFQQTVWRQLQTIPRGETVSYSTIAQRIGRPLSVRAVANACAANPIAVFIPCHRVLSKTGALAGYRWGLECKRQLLAREGIISP
jgi:AraC family transcriptional regulator, regulatory protein of adaptative response / methylated-DNA-[protein]-cysteine methyltransferase